MDRLSLFATRDSSKDSAEKREKAEEEAIANLMESLRISKEKKESQKEEQPNGDAQADGEPVESNGPTDAPALDEGTPSSEEQIPKVNGENESASDILGSVKLFEIFNEQVVSLVKMQRLQIQDTIALLVSLANLALYVLICMHRAVN